MTPRRSPGWMTGLAGGLLSLLPGLAEAAGVQPPDSGFHAPSDARVLTRSLRRRLGDGSEIRSIRRYAVRFVAEGRGWRVEGRQIDARVEAPPRLAALAEIEQQRRDDAMFPMHLDPRGQVVAYPASTGDQPAPHRVAIRKVEDMIAGAPLDDAERQQALLLAARLGTAVTAWPTDLFQPVAANRTESRDYRLDDGGTGRISVAVSAHAKDGVVNRFERVVTTTSAGQTRESTETWLLEAGNP